MINATIDLLQQRIVDPNLPPVMHLVPGQLIVRDFVRGLVSKDNGQ